MIRGACLFGDQWVLLIAMLSPPQSPDTLPSRCSVCGIESALPGVFIRRRRSFRTTTRDFCPVCWAKKQHSSFGWRIANWLATLIGGVALAWFVPQIGLGWLLINVACFDLFNVLTIVPHELGHAFVARMLGLRVFKIIVGTGRPWFRTRLFGIATEFKMLLLGGLAFAAHRRVAGYRWRQFLFVMGGPAVNLGLIGVALFAKPAGTVWDFAALREGFVPLQVFFYANMVVLLVNLWPRMIQTDVGPLASDGKLLFRAVFSRSGDAANSHAMLFAMEGIECRERNDFQSARRWFEEGQARYPDNETLKAFQTCNMLDAGEFATARNLLLPELAKEDLVPAIRALLLNNIAYADALLGGPELLDEADRYSTEALALLPWMSAVQGTRGTVLLAMGRIGEAMPLLQKSFEETMALHGKAQNACFLAMANARSGDDGKAAEYLRLAREYDPKCFLLERAAREIDN